MQPKHPQQPNGDQPKVPTLVIEFNPHDTRKFRARFVNQVVPQPDVVNALEMIKATMIAQQTMMMQQEAQQQDRSRIVGLDGKPFQG